MGGKAKAPTVTTEDLELQRMQKELIAKQLDQVNKEEAKVKTDLAARADARLRGTVGRRSLMTNGYEGFKRGGDLGAA